MKNDFNILNAIADIMLIIVVLTAFFLLNHRVNAVASNLYQVQSENAYLMQEVNSINNSIDNLYQLNDWTEVIFSETGTSRPSTS